jgi:hypothetical protein
LERGGNDIFDITIAEEPEDRFFGVMLELLLKQLLSLD